jgi:hypothetical protein
MVKPKKATAVPPAPRRNIYPWEDWCDGNARVATPGVDFDNTPAAFASAGRQWARRGGHTWISTVQDGKVYFTLTRATA